MVMEKVVKFIKREAIKLVVAAALTAVLFLILGQTVIMPPEQCRDCFITKGLPFPYELSGGFAGQTQLLPVFLLLDVLVWFCLSLLIVYAFEFARNKLSKKSKA